MARSRRTGAKVATRSAKPSASRNGVPDVYREMLRDAVTSSPPLSDAERPLKRRKIRGHAIASGVPESDLSARGSIAGHTTDGHTTDGIASEDYDGLAQPQTQYDESEVSSESDVNWEEVDFQEVARVDDGSENAQQLELVIGDPGASKLNLHQRSKRRQATSAERKIKLEIHKMHLLCLLAHVHLRNHWCNDDEVHRFLRNIVSKRTVSYLNPREDMSQFQRTRSLNDGLSQAIDAFNFAFTKTARGMGRPYWAENNDELVEIDLPKDLDLPMQKADFRDAANKREGSRDVGAQLFCALLRSVGVDARLTCSLQPLPFHSQAKTKTLQTKESIAMERYYNEQPKNAEQHVALESSSHDHDRDKTPKAIGSVGGRSRFASSPASHVSAHSNSDNSLSNKKPIIPKTQSVYPVYWVEAFDEAAQKWIPVDPLVTKTVGKSRKFEPPMSDCENNLSYVISFEDDGSARDVTKRYAKAYNAKTRKTRVEVTTDGDRWRRRVLKMYKRSHRLDRDQVEDAELARKEAQEGLPRNVQDFKDHPYYALERHLRRNEVIHPKREMGNIHAGRAGSEKIVEPIYRRGDVHIVRSADRWYRLGREIKAGEQPLKRVTPSRSQISSREYGGDTQTEVNDDEENAGTSLYAFHQTAEYKPPPVVNGKIPKNVYGNLDLYVPSMIPAGAIHFKHPETQRAARLLGVDYADAVTGFAFKGRHGTAVIEGAVVASEYAEAVQAILAGFQDERAQAEEERRSLEALRMWKRLLAALRIRERIEGYEIEGERDAAYDEAVSQDDARSSEEGGGFMPELAGEPFAEPTAGRTFYQHSSNEGSDEEYDGMVPSTFNHRSVTRTLTKNSGASGGEDNRSASFLAAEDHDAEEALLDIHHRPTEYVLSNESENCEGGGFLMDEDGNPTDYEGRGFFLDENDFEPPKIIQNPEPTDAVPTPPPNLATRYSNQDPTRQPSIQEPAVATNPPPSHPLPAHHLHATASPLPDTDLAGPQSHESSSSPPLPRPLPLASFPHPIIGLTSTPPEIQANPSDPESSVLSGVTEGDCEDETGSLLAEDPSDEDAEPEWLA